MEIKNLSVWKRFTIAYSHEAIGDEEFMDNMLSQLHNSGIAVTYAGEKQYGLTSKAGDYEGEIVLTVFECASGRQAMEKFVNEHGFDRCDTLESGEVVYY